VSDVSDVGYVERQNYVIYLLTAFLVYSFFRLPWNRTSLMQEKIMQTLDGMLLAPGSRLYILIGKASRVFIEIAMSVVIFTVALIFLRPTIILNNLLIGSFSLILLFVIFISVDFIVSAIGLAHVGISQFFVSYLPRGIALVGCAYYPVDVIPEILRPLVFINPLYHAVNLFRSGFMEADLRFGWEVSFLYLLVLAIIIPIISGFFFDWALKRWGVRGY
jgi:ABC-2 type transport system permease protein